MKTQHDGDCTIYASLSNSSPEVGICTCGYGLQLIRRGDWSQIYSQELIKKLEEDAKTRPECSELLKKIFGE